MNDRQARALKELALKSNYGQGRGHAHHVSKLGLQVYEELVRLGMLERSDRTQQIIEISCMLHDVGLFPRLRHNERGFDLVEGFLKKLPGGPLPEEEASAILHCILWHRGDVFAERGAIGIVDREYAEKVASIIRVADALDRSLRQVVSDVTMEITDRKAVLTVQSTGNVDAELSRANERANLMKAAYGFDEIGFKRGIPSE